MWSLLLLPFFIGLGKAIFTDEFPENCVPYCHIQLAGLLEAQARFPAGLTLSTGTVQPDVQ